MLFNRCRHLTRGLPVALLFALASACSTGDETPPATRGSVAAPLELPASEGVPRIADASRAGRPVIFVGLDGADWSYLDGYMRAGKMPHLASLVNEGRDGILLTEHPPLSPLLWTTMMTGASPLEHGILDFTRLQPGSGIKEPITSEERQVPAIWNMASYGGRSVAVFGLWATYPAEAVHGLMVSDRLMTFLYQEESPPPGVVYPAARESWARVVLREEEDAVGLDELRHYLPWLTAEEYARHETSDDPYAHPIGALRRILVETRVYHRLATDHLAREAPDLSVVYIQGSDSVGHVFAPFAAPRQASVSAEEFERYNAVPEKYFEYLDGLLGDYRRLAEAHGAVLVLASDHGFHWHEGRPERLSSSGAATAARWHRQEGIFLLWGPGIEPEQGDRERAGLRRVAATLLELLGLPEGRQVAGPPLPGATDPVGKKPGQGKVVDYRAEYKPPERMASSVVAPAAGELAKLRALGYLGADEVPAEDAASQASLAAFDEATVAGSVAGRTAGYYNNRALILKAEGRSDAAAAAFEGALALDANLASALWNLSDLLFAEGEELDRSDRLLVRAVANDLPEGIQYLIGRAIGYSRNDQAGRAYALLESAVSVRPEEPELWLFRGRYRIDRGECSEALADFEQAIELDPDQASAHASAAAASVCLGDRPSAVSALRKALALDPDQPAIHQFLEQLL